MKTLVVGATGATGRLLVEQLLHRGQEVVAIVRSPDKMPEHLRGAENLSIVEGAALDLSDEELARHVQGCDAVASCLGHTLSFGGVYGKPRKLVTDTARRLCEAIKQLDPDKQTKFVLMNTAGNSNRDLEEPISFGQKCVIGLLRLLLPPHVDNEKAADYLRTEIGSDDPKIEWSVVRPDNLIDEEKVTPYKLHPSPTRSAIFDAGK
ncbi:MAG: NAD(P)-binding oxidoreductase, partial [Verrucomicrobiota bacterium]